MQRMVHDEASGAIRGASVRHDHASSTVTLAPMTALAQRRKGRPRYRQDHGTQFAGGVITYRGRRLWVQREATGHCEMRRVRHGLYGVDTADEALPWEKAPHARLTTWVGAAVRAFIRHSLGLHQQRWQPQTQQWQRLMRFTLEAAIRRQLRLRLERTNGEHTMDRKAARELWHAAVLADDCIGWRVRRRRRRRRLRRQRQRQQQHRDVG